MAVEDTVMTIWRLKTDDGHCAMIFFPVTYHSNQDSFRILITFKMLPLAENAKWTVGGEALFYCNGVDKVDIGECSIPIDSNMYNVSVL